jgi:CRP/FNR family transcriptional regulator, cyclic AMP receptor protein
MQPRRDIPRQRGLREIPLFAGCRDSDLEEIARLADPIDFAEGETLVLEGTRGQYAYVVVSGWVEVLVEGRCVNRVGPGCLVGELAVLDLQPRSATLRAAGPVETFAFDLRGLNILMRMETVAPRIIRQLAERLRRAEQAAQRRDAMNLVPVG